MTVDLRSYESWLKEVDEALSSINMPMQDWQKSWAFDFRSEFAAKTTATDAAMFLGDGPPLIWARRSTNSPPVCGSTSTCRKPAPQNYCRNIRCLCSLTQCAFSELHQGPAARSCSWTLSLGCVCCGNCVQRRSAHILLSVFSITRFQRTSNQRTVFAQLAPLSLNLIPVSGEADNIELYAKSPIVHCGGLFCQQCAGAPTPFLLSACSDSRKIVHLCA